MKNEQDGKGRKWKQDREKERKKKEIEREILEQGIQLTLIWRRGVD